VTEPTISPQRRRLLHDVATMIPAGTRSPTLVAIDGVDGSGKSVFADQLAEVVAAQRPVIRASIDDFHRPRAERYRRGRDSPLGFWLDSFDYDRLRAELLDPLSPSGSRLYRAAAHDLVTDRTVSPVQRVAPPSSVLVLDGLFLHRDELRDYWHLSVFLDVPFEVSVARMATRDGSPLDPGHTDLHRYVGGQRLYFAECEPMSRAAVVVDNGDWDNPSFRRRPPRGLR
jgi:uridine kinase